MSATSTTTGQWSPEVLAYAAEHGVEQYLDPLREATLRVFPTAEGLRVFRDDDPELRDVRWIVFEVHVPEEELANFVVNCHRWSEEKRRVCSPPLGHHFVLDVRSIQP